MDLDAGRGQRQRAFVMAEGGLEIAAPLFEIAEIVEGIRVGGVDLARRAIGGCGIVDPREGRQSGRTRGMRHGRTRIEADRLVGRRKCAARIARRKPHGRKIGEHFGIVRQQCNGRSDANQRGFVVAARMRHKAAQMQRIDVFRGDRQNLAVAGEGAVKIALLVPLEARHERGLHAGCVA